MAFVMVFVRTASIEPHVTRIRMRPVRTRVNHAQSLTTLISVLVYDQSSKSKAGLRTRPWVHKKTPTNIHGTPEHALLLTLAIHLLPPPPCPPPTPYPRSQRLEPLDKLCKAVHHAAAAAVGTICRRRGVCRGVCGDVCRGGV